MKRTGFTMIELIFVIVILGILAAVAIPKLAATRTDAEVSKEVTNLATKVNDFGSQFTATGAFLPADITTANLTLACYSLSTAGVGGLIVTERPGGAAGAGAGAAVQTVASVAACSAAHLLTRKQGLSAAAPITHAFGGAGVVY